MMLYVYAGTDKRTGKAGTDIVRAAHSADAARIVGQWRTSPQFLASFPATAEGQRAAEAMAIRCS